jgi:hypothetical protein
MGMDAKYVALAAAVVTALRRSMLPEHTAHPPLGDSHHPSDMIDAAPTPGGAQ